MTGLYIHIPFCKQKCHYCDFHFLVSLRFKKELLGALIKELFLRKDEVKGFVKTVYFGGGTPSLLTYKELSAVMDSLYTHYKIAESPEITIEVNPDDISVSYLKNLKRLGFNRLSIGVQSFFDTDLKFLNRPHNALQATESIKKAQDSGIDNINIDLIYGIPTLTIEKWQQNIDTFLALQVPHLSAYALTVERKTILYHFIKKGKIARLNEDTALQEYRLLTEIMQKNGLIHYEISNFSKQNYLSQHNTNYWLGAPYIGIGPSAHSYQDKQRSWNIANNARYIKSITSGALPSEIETLSLSDRYNEYLLTRLRTMWGIELKTIAANFGNAYLAYFKERIRPYVKNKQLKITANQKVVIAPKALFLSDGIIADLFWDAGD